MPNVGDQLRMARERLKLTVHDVANSTNIKSDHVRAMESCAWDVFSARVYIKGFVRTYATFLKLDVGRIVAELEEDLGRNPDFNEEAGESRRRKGPVDWAMLQMSRVRWKLIFPVLVGLAVLVAAVYGLKAWQRQTKSDPLHNLGPGLHQQHRPLGTPTTLPLPTNAPAPRRGPGTP